VYVLTTVHFLNTRLSNKKHIISNWASLALHPKHAIQRATSQTWWTVQDRQPTSSWHTWRSLLKRLPFAGRRAQLPRPQASTKHHSAFFSVSSFGQSPGWLPVVTGLQAGLVESWKLYTASVLGASAFVFDVSPTDGRAISSVGAFLGIDLKRGLPCFSLAYT